MRLFEVDTGGTYSDEWYRVSQLQPRLNPIAHVVRQSSGDTVWYIIEDPAGSRYFRAGEGAYFFAALLDGRRTVDDAWEACCAQLGDAAPTQRSCLDILMKLQSFGLLLGDDVAAADLVGERIRRGRKSRREKRTGRWFFLSVPLVNPERPLAATNWLWKAAWGPLGLILFLASVVAGGYSVWTNADQLADPINELMTPTRLMLVGLIFIVLRAVHELGHATACKAYGGRCTEIGLFLVALILPLPYCDASSSWRFPERWKRIMVALGGVMVELFIAGIAAVIWANTSATDAPALKNVCYHVMLVSGVATFLFNLNPLLRYDGYYILSDLIAAPNLAQRSKEIWRYLTERIAFGVKRSRPPTLRSRSEAIWLFFYALASTPYRLFIAVSIILLVSSKYLTVGVVIAVATATIMLIWPSLKGAWYLLSSPTLIGRRVRAFAVVAVVLGALIGGLGFVPAPAAEISPATIEARWTDPIRAPLDGFVESFLVSPGDEVEAGQPLILLRNDPLDIQITELESIRRLTEAQLAQAETESPALAVLARQKLDLINERLADAVGRRDSLTVRATRAGRYVAPGAIAGGLDRLTGVFVSRGEPLGSVASRDSLVVRAYVSDREHAYVFRNDDLGAVPASVRLWGRAGLELPAVVTATEPVASRGADLAVTTLAGGEVEITQDAEGNQIAMVPQFRVDLQPSDDGRWAEAGEIRAGLRARVRFAAPDEPLGAQWFRRASRYFEERFAGGGGAL
ncbi:MAG: hypothetical protein AAGB51_00800 [Planctomycetota bacterium]